MSETTHERDESNHYDADTEATYDPRSQGAPEATPAAPYVDPDETIAEKLARKQDRSERPRVPSATNDRDTRLPQDFQQSKASRDAARAEALAEEEDDEHKITAYYGEVELRFDPAAFDLRFQFLCEQGRPLHGLLHVLGEEEMEKLLAAGIPATSASIQGVIDSLGKQAGLGD